MISILDLPVKPKDRDEAVATSVILDTFLKERNSVSNANELVTFVSRWKNIWLLRDESVRSKEENDISELKFNSNSIFDIFVRMIHGEDNFDFNQSNTRVAATIAVPPSSINALMLSKKFRCNSDIGFVRLYLDSYKELEDKLRGY